MQNKIDRCDNLHLYRISYLIQSQRVCLRSNFDPKLLQIEYNIVYIPPIKFNLSFDSLYRWGEGMNGEYPQLTNECSLSYLTSMMLKYDYVLLQVVLWDAWFVKKEYLPSLRFFNAMYFKLCLVFKITLPYLEFHI